MGQSSGVTTTPPPRPPLEPASLSRAAGTTWSVTLLPTAESTNTVAASNPVDHRVVIADHQTSGRGRLDRSWVAPPGSALTFSATVDPAVEPAAWPLVPLAAGLAVAAAVRRAGGAATVKWPNDVLLDGGDGSLRKLAGILVERVGDPPLAVVGIGINVSITEAELPVPTATSLSLAGVTVERATLFGWVLEELDAALQQMRGDRAGFLDRYRQECSTVGRDVQVSLPGGSALTGPALSVDESGRLVVEGPDGAQAVAAGDVVHVRPL